MAETQVIKSFLVALGFKADEAALKKFNDGILSATKAVEKLAVAVSATALAVAIGVERFASNLEKLYFASQRSGTTATHLKALGRAAEDFGSSADEAMQAIEGLTDFLRNNPGGEGQINTWLGHIGKKLTGDKEKDLESIGELFAQNTKSGQGYLNTQLAGQWGIPRNLMLALQNPEFLKDLDSIEERLKKAGFDEAAEHAHQFMVQLRDLGDWLVIIATRVQDAIQKRWGVSLEKINAYMQAHGDELTKKIVDGVQKILDVSEKVIHFFEWLNNATGGLSTKILGVLALLQLVGGGPIIGGVLSLAGAFIRLGVGIAAAAGSAASLAAGAGGGLLAMLATGTAGVAVAGAAGYGLGALANKLFPNLSSSLGESLFNAVHPAFNAVETLTNLGWSKEQANGIVARLQRESNLIPSSVGDYGQAYGIAQWHPERQAAFAKWAGHDIHGSSQEEQLRYIDYELRHGTDAGAREAGMNIRQTDNAADAYEYFTRMFERPKNVESEVAKGRATLELSNQTTINVQGSQSNEATAKAIADKQKQVNSDLVRNLKPTVQ